MTQFNTFGSKQATLKNSGYKELPEPKLGVIRGGFLVPRGTEIATADLLVAKATYETGMKNPLATRWFYVPLFDAFTDKSTEDVYVDSLQGQKFSEEGKIAYQATVEVNKYTSLNMRSWNDKQWDWIPFDESASIMATSSDGTIAKGFAITFRTTNQKLAEQGTKMMQPIEIVYQDATQWADEGVVVEPMNLSSADWNPITDIDGVYDVDIAQVGTATSSLIVVSVYKSGIDSANAISNVTGLVVGDFVVKDAAGATVTVDSIVDNGDGTYDLIGSGVFVTLGTANIVATASVSLTTIAIDSTGDATVTI